MVEMYYRIYAELSDGDVICIDELTEIKADHKTIDKAATTIVENAAEIKALVLDDNVTVTGVSIVQVVMDENDCKTELVMYYNIDDLE